MLFCGACWLPVMRDPLQDVCRRASSYDPREIFGVLMCFFPTALVVPWFSSRPTGASEGCEGHLEGAGD